MISLSQKNFRALYKFPLKFNKLFLTISLLYLSKNGNLLLKILEIFVMYIYIYIKKNKR